MRKDQDSIEAATAGGRSQRNVGRRTLHAGRKFDFEMVSVEMSDGRTVEREMVRHPGAVAIVPVLDSGDLVFIRNARFAVGRTLLEFPAGTIEKEEPPAICAARELIEETGYDAATLSPLGWFYTTPGLTDERMHTFVGTGLRHVGQNLEDDELIETEVMSVSRALDLVDQGGIVDAKSMLALLLAIRRGFVKAG